MDGVDMSGRTHEEVTGANRLALARTRQGYGRFPRLVLSLTLSVIATPALAASAGDTSFIFLVMLVLVVGGVLLLSAFVTSIFAKRVPGKNYVRGVFYFLLWSSVLAVTLFWIMTASSSASDLFGGFLVVMGLLAAVAVLYAILHSRSAVAEAVAKQPNESQR